MSKTPRNTTSPNETSDLSQKARIFSPFVPSIYSNPNQNLDDLPPPLKFPGKKSASPSNSSKRKAIIDMTIDIGGNSDRRILIHQGDDSRALARQFCIENNLDLRCCELISREVDKQVKAYLEKKAKPSKTKKDSKTPRKKQKSLHNVSEDSRKLKKNLSVKSFREDGEINANEFGPKSERNLGKFNKLVELPQKKEEDCTFRPKINGPASLFYDESTSGKRFETLYAKHKQKEAKKSRVLDEFIAETCSFRPEINEKYHKKNKSKTPDVGERLYETRNQWNKNQKDREKIQRNYDLKTGQRLFHPVIKKDKYYEKAKLREQNENQIKVIPNLDEKQQKQVISEAQKPIKKTWGTNENYEKAHEKLKGKKMMNSRSDKNLRAPPAINKCDKEDIVLKELFDALDANKDGWISRNQLDFSKLDDELLEIIANLALEGFPAKEALDFGGFVNLLDQMKIKELLIKIIKEKKPSKCPEQSIAGESKTTKLQKNFQEPSIYDKIERKLDRLEEIKKQDEEKKNGKMTNRYKKIVENSFV